MSVHIYTCPLCGRFAGVDGRLFTDVEAVTEHIDATADELHEGEAGDDYTAAIAESGNAVSIGDLTGETGPTISFEEAEPIITVDGEQRRFGQVVEDLQADMAKLQTKFDRVIQEQQRDLEDLEDRLGAHQLAIQELQAGFEKLAAEQQQDVTYQFEL